MKYLKRIKKILGINSITKSELYDLMIDFEYYYKWVVDENDIIIYLDSRTIDKEEVIILLKDVQKRLLQRGVKSEILDPDERYRFKNLSSDMILHKMYGEYVIFRLNCKIKGFEHRK